MTYTKEQLWSMSSKEMRNILQSHRIIAYYNDGKILSGQFNFIITASNNKDLPYVLRISNNQNIYISDPKLVEIEVL